MNLRSTAFNQVSTGIAAVVVGAVLLFRSDIAAWVPWAGGGILLLGAALIALGIRHYRTSPPARSDAKRQAGLRQCLGLAAAVLTLGVITTLRALGPDHGSPVSGSIDLVIGAICLVALVIALIGAGQAVHRTRR